MATVEELRAKITPYGPWHMVPPETPLERCRSCSAEIFWITTPKDKPLPIDCDPRGGRRPGTNPRHWGLGVSHFATCSDAKSWSKRT